VVMEGRLRGVRCLSWAKRLCRKAGLGLTVIGGIRSCSMFRCKQSDWVLNEHLVRLLQIVELSSNFSIPQSLNSSNVN
jgi:hypothetical protein